MRLATSHTIHQSGCAWPGGGQCRAFFMPDANPFDLAPPNRIRKRIERIAYQSKESV